MSSSDQLTPDAAALLDREREARVMRKVTWRLVPFMFLCYVISYLDRVNIGFASTALKRDLDLTNYQYGWCAGIFFAGYCFLEVPSNLILEKVGARRWIARIMVIWGLVSMAMVFISGFWSFFGMRVALGIAEAGFFPGMILYLTYWVPARYRAKTGAMFMMAIPIAMLIGPWASEPLLAMTAFGWKGWQWMFFIEGLPAVLGGIAALYVLTDSPEKATWLAPDDREWLSKEMAKERKERSKHVVGLSALKHPKVLLLCLIYCFNVMATYGIFFFLPQIFREASGWSGTRFSLLTSIPFVAALIGMVLVGRHSDKTGERKWHVVACALLAAAGLVLAAAFPNNLVIVVLGFTMSQVGQRSLLSVFWAIPPIFLAGTAAAAGIALINSVGNVGGFIGPYLMGAAWSPKDGYAIGLVALAAALTIEAILVATMKVPTARPKAEVISTPAASKAVAV